MINEPCDPALFPERHHIIQVYDSEYVFMESLECFVTCGLRAGEGVVLFATARHLQDLQIRLHSSRLQLDRASWQDRYIPVIANEALNKFMVDGWPDENLFKKVIGELLDRAQAGGRQVRAFSEMVGLLLATGESAATVRVEQVWNECCRERELTLFCAYSSACFPGRSAGALEAVCEEHDWILDGHARADPTPPALSAGHFDYWQRFGMAFDEAIAFDISRVAEVRPLSHGAKSAAAWSIPGTGHSDTGTRWVLRPAHQLIR
jgi:hypothetical protein